MLFLITSVLSIINLLFLLSLIAFALLDSEFGWFADSPQVRVIFAYSTIFLEQTTIDLVTNKYNSYNYKENNGRVKYNLFIGFLGLAFFGICHLINDGQNNSSLASIWFLSMLVLLALPRYPSTK